MGKKKKRSNSKLTMEDYITFFQNPDVHDFNTCEIQEILSINGFCQLQNKGKVMEDLSGQELINPRRSTVRSHGAVFPLAPLTVEEVKDDVRAIGWDSCPIGSIVAVGSAAEDKKKAAAAKKRRTTKKQQRALVPV